MSSAAVEAFSGAGESLGVVCWRIEKFEPVKQDNVGVFAEGKARLWCGWRGGGGADDGKEVFDWFGKKAVGSVIVGMLGIYLDFGL